MAPKKRGTSSLPLRRSVGTRSPKKRVVVVCEGAKTEPSYLTLISPRTKDSLVELEIVPESATTPKQLVETACFRLRGAEKIRRRTRDPNDSIDEIWCAFDVDEHPRLHEACQQARDNGVKLAISNPSIELWFLLHFVDQTANIHRKDALRNLRNYIGDYDKKFTDLDSLLGKYRDAKDRARRLAQKHMGDGTNFPADNPSSGMWELVDSLGVIY